MQKTDIFNKDLPICLVGIGGVSMSGLALTLKADGFDVYGSDRAESDATRALAAAGIRVVIGHSGGTVEGAGAVVRTAAVRDDNPEIARARELSIPVFERAEAWSVIMRRHRDVVCVAGCHGKSTTTAMCVHAALAAGRRPSVMIGADLPVIGGNYAIGDGELFIAEACEYYDSFLSFPPSVAVIGNIEEDHLDYFADLAAIKASFRRFAQLVPPHGAVAANADDPNTRDALRDYGGRIIWFGMGADAQVRAENVDFSRGFPSFTLVTPSGRAPARLMAPGIYNVYNALAAAAAMSALGIGAQDTARGLAEYGGIARRFEYRGEVGGAAVVDDYAHHPTALGELVAAARGMGYRRVICAFQPHTYSRTAAFYGEFKKALGSADIILLADVYAAREVNVYGVDMKRMAEEIPGARYFPDFTDMADYIKSQAREGDIVLTAGAGDIWRLNRLLC